MKGLELAKAYYETCGRPMLEEQFPQLLDRIAIGLTGSGSECFGYDDELSSDHDFEPGFIIFLPDEEEIDSRTAFRLERAYSSLPKEFMGYSRSRVAPVGGARHGVIRISDFLMEKTGTPDGHLTPDQWLRIPPEALAEAVNGQIWHDGSGQISSIRKELGTWPEDIRLKKLAGSLLLMGQAGQYNYLRCVKRGETGAAQLAVFEFVRACMDCVFLLNKVYPPYYKWKFRAMRALKKLPLLAELMEYLVTTDNDDSMARDKYEVIESTAADVIGELKAQKLTGADCADLEKHAYSVNDRIADADIRNRHILSGV